MMVVILVFRSNNDGDHNQSRKTTRTPMTRNQPSTDSSWRSARKSGREAPWVAEKPKLRPEIDRRVSA